MTNDLPGATLDEAVIADFGRAIDALRAEVENSLGERDRDHIERIQRLSRRLEVAGRALLHLSVEPLSFTTGVVALGAHKCLELMEIGHMALHGAYESFTNDERLRADKFVWRAPIDEVSWRRGHNIRHHQYTNIAGRDPDLDFVGLRLSPKIAFRRLHRLQPVSNVITWLGFSLGINMHVTGVLDKLSGKRGETKHAAADQAGAQEHPFLSKTARYYGRELVLFPALAGPFFLKVALGNLLSDVLRDVCAGTIIYCGHVGATDYPADTKPGSRARWYVMQAEGASNVELPHVFSILCGGLDKQIEHHLFPRLPPNRLREIAPRVRAICAEHGVTYRSAGWRRSVRGMLKSLRSMSRDDDARTMRGNAAMRGNAMKRKPGVPGVVEVPSVAG